MMTVPGIGAMTALAFEAAIDDASAEVIVPTAPLTDELSDIIAAHKFQGL